MLGTSMKIVITSKLCSIPQILMQTLVRDGKSNRLIYDLSTFSGSVPLNEIFHLFRDHKYPFDCFPHHKIK